MSRPNRIHSQGVNSATRDLLASFWISMDAVSS